jgi:hypothetical protein
MRKNPMLTQSQAQEFAQEWVAAWNSHDLDRILSHYEEEVVLISPIAARLLGDPTGTVQGKAALRRYFQKGLEVYPNLQFELLDVIWGIESLVLYYINQQGTQSGEFMKLNNRGKVTRVIAHYNN